MKFVFSGLPPTTYTYAHRLVKHVLTFKKKIAIEIELIESDGY
jgi:hypothetical protein